MTHKCMQIFKMVKLGKFPCRTELGLNVASVYTLLWVNVGMVWYINTQKKVLHFPSENILYELDVVYNFELIFPIFSLSCCNFVEFLFIFSCRSFYLLTKVECVLGVVSYPFIM